MRDIDQIGFFTDGPAAVAKAKMADKDARISELERQRDDLVKVLRKAEKACASSRVLAEIRAAIAAVGEKG